MSVDMCVNMSLDQGNNLLECKIANWTTHSDAQELTVS